MGKQNPKERLPQPMTLLLLDFHWKYAADVRGAGRLALNSHTLLQVNDHPYRSTRRLQ